MAIADAVKSNHPSIATEIGGFLRSPPAAPSNVAYFLKYENIVQLGNTDSGDGVKFRGRGFKQLTGRYNYSRYWMFRGWLDGKSYDQQWFKKSKPGPLIDNPEIAGNDPFTCVDTAGFYCAYRNVAKAADAGVNEVASFAVSRLVNPVRRKKSAVTMGGDKECVWKIGRFQMRRLVIVVPLSLLWACARRVPYRVV